MLCLLVALVPQMLCILLVIMRAHLLGGTLAKIIRACWHSRARASFYVAWVFTLTFVR